MEKLSELESFFDTKYSKDEIATAINNVNTRVYVDLFLNTSLSVRDFVFTALSFKSSCFFFSYIWSSFQEKPNIKFLVKTSYDVIKDKFYTKNEVGIAIRHFLSDEQKRRNA